MLLSTAGFFSATIIPEKLGLEVDLVVFFFVEDKHEVTRVYIVRIVPGSYFTTSERIEKPMSRYAYFGILYGQHVTQKYRLPRAILSPAPRTLSHRHPEEASL
ncbi:hypothetical protein SAMN02745181_1175 [Rubritalea squalenifaciens DSM 18772]|uniref:Uncharacterized protein n=1 Tax=Rubritalea squalenifaciens DSM 18772 TaxID=1123071 RepID=A0A1M6GHV8_9BACT|nr:hypothetical protein SAMN02745181_1175 [Rubritalea squalenifaciens DSM 18772]